MSKRDLAFLSTAAERDLEPRTKRRRETKSVDNEEDVTMDDATKVEEDTGATALNPDGVKEKGLALWQIVKDAQDKEGRQLSYEFLRLPSKRQYPDYFVQIKRPISLDEVKKALDQDNYTSLQQVKDDIGQCFNNAKKYNLKDSPIWLDAKVLHKLVKKEFIKMTGSNEEEGGDEEGGGDGDGTKKAKVPNLYRQLKGKMQKLIDKTDEDGRLLSDLFMELPLKRDYPTYFKEIKKPESFGNIQRKLKQKEYTTSAEFAADIELVFSNAFAFNQEHSFVWDDAQTLREYFRVLMSDLPAPFLLPEYAKPPRPSNKIKLKMPGASATSPSGQDNGAQAAFGSSFTLRVPGGNETAKPPQVPVPVPVKVKVHPKPQVTSALNPTTTQGSPAPIYNNTLPLAPLTSQAQPTQTPTLQPVQTDPRPAVPYQYQHYPNAAYHLPATMARPTRSPSTTRVAPAPATLPAMDQQSFTKSPSPSGRRPLQVISLITKPKGRLFNLHHLDGVKTWSMRLGQRESAITVMDIRFQGDDEADPNSDVNGEEEEEEEEEPSIRTVKRGRGRPPKSAPKPLPKPKVTRSSKPSARKSAILPQGNIRIVLNGDPIKDKDSDEGVWEADLAMGRNILEIGEEGGVLWKVYLERLNTS